MSDYVSPWLDEELMLFRTNVRKFFERDLSPHAERWIAQGMCDRDAWLKCGEAGVLCASIPEAYGGAGGNYTHEAIIGEEEVFSGVAAFGLTVHSGIVAHYILHYGSEEQRLRWLPKMATGEMVGAICMTEPDVGSDLQNVRTTAIRDGDTYVVNGAKTFVTNGQHANLLCLVVKTDPDEGAKGVSLLMLETEGSEGFSRGRNLKKIGLEANDTSELFFEDVRVPVANRLGDSEGQGFFQLMEQLPQERLAIAIYAVAVMEKAIRLTTTYVKERKAFGKPLIGFQNTRFKLAEAKTEAHVARVFVDRCLVDLLEGNLSVERAAMAKWWTTQKQCEIVDECLQLFGGYGYMVEYPIARLWMDSRVQKIYGGTNEIMKELISRGL